MDDALRQRLQGWEEELMQIGTRRNAARLGELLHPDFREFGASGRIFDRSAIVQALSVEVEAQLRLGEFRVQEIADDVVLATYRSWRTDANGAEREALRSSLWVRGGERWQLRFHQGTVVASGFPGRNES